MAEPCASNCGTPCLKLRSRFQITASALKGVPSWNFTPLRSLNVHFLGSPASCCQLSARPGTMSAGLSALVRSQLTRASKAVKPRKRTPSKPLLGTPVVVGTSLAVMAIRSVPCATAGEAIARAPSHAATVRPTSGPVEIRLVMTFIPHPGCGVPGCNAQSLSMQRRPVNCSLGLRICQQKGVFVRTLSEPEARGPEEHEKTRHWSGAPMGATLAVVVQAQPHPE